MNNKQNPFSSHEQQVALEELLNRRLIKRITILEGHYPSKHDQKAFLQRVIDFVLGKSSKL